MSEHKSHWFSRHRSKLTIAAEVAAVVAVLVPAGVWLVQHVSGKPPAPGTSSSASAGAGTGATQPQDASSPGGPTVYLAALTPYAGGPNIAALPHGLAGRPGYERALVVGCATNQSGDKYRSVTYLLERRYSTFHASLLPYYGAPDESKVRYEVYLDDQQKSRIDVEVNHNGPLDVDVYGADKMEVRITCEQPDSVGILADAYLVHS